MLLSWTHLGTYRNMRNVYIYKRLARGSQIVSAEQGSQNVSRYLRITYYGKHRLTLLRASIKKNKNNNFTTLQEKKQQQQHKLSMPA